MSEQINHRAGVIAGEPPPLCFSPRVVEALGGTSRKLSQYLGRSRPRLCRAAAAAKGSLRSQTTSKNTKNAAMTVTSKIVPSQSLRTPAPPPAQNPARAI